jgi:hypothetical protein
MTSGVVTNMYHQRASPHDWTVLIHLRQKKRSHNRKKEDKRSITMVRLRFTRNEFLFLGLKLACWLQHSYHWAHLRWSQPWEVQGSFLRKSKKHRTDFDRHPGSRTRWRSSRTLISEFFVSTFTKKPAVVSGPHTGSTRKRRRNRDWRQHNRMLATTTTT